MFPIRVFRSTTNIVIVQEKYGRSSASRQSRAGADDDDDDAVSDDLSGSSSSSEEEDDEGVLASEALDAQINETIQAIRRKDPRVYDAGTYFFQDPADGTEDEAAVAATTSPKQTKPMYLSDYQRQNLLEGVNGIPEDDEPPKTYAQEQDEHKIALVNEIHKGPRREDDSSSEENGGEDDFLTQKRSTQHGGVIGGKKTTILNHFDVENAEKDPDTFLSNFLSTRAWVPSAESNFQPFESDDEEEDVRAEKFEEAFNMRFEDPHVSNEKILSHARDITAKYSVRKEVSNSRKKTREKEREKKESEKRQREEEKARLRKLRIDDAEQKIRKIKDAAGLKQSTMSKEDWSTFLEEAWDDEHWEEHMKNRFGEDYYEDHDLDNASGEAAKESTKVKKPKWEDDIHIKDLVPDFDTEEQAVKERFALSESEFEDSASPTLQPEDGTTSPTSKSHKSKRREKEERRKEARKERRNIERLVDQEMDEDRSLSKLGKKHAGFFRYRETSPTAFGLTPRDILLASDSQLNQYAGLKTIASFRDKERKKKDKKRLSKKARLRQWRKDTFGSESGPQATLAETFGGRDGAQGVVKSMQKRSSDLGNERRKSKSQKKATAGGK